MSSVKAQMTIFTRTGCGHCTKLKAEALGLLLSDPQLKAAGINVVHYPVGDEPGFHTHEEFRTQYNNIRSPADQIRGFPTIEMAEPGDRKHRRKFDEWVTWEGKRGADSIKAWALKVLKDGSYKASAAPAGSMSGPKLDKSKTDFRAESSRQKNTMQPSIPARNQIPTPLSKREVKAQRIFVDSGAWSSDEEY